jgi:hypothetical protein
MAAFEFVRNCGIPHTTSATVNIPHTKHTKTQKGKKCDHLLGGFLGAFIKLRKVTFVMSVRMEQLDCRCTDFDETLYELFSKIYRENSSFIKIR